MNELSGPVPKKQTFVQTERKAHLALGKLAIKHPSAAAILHQLIALMDRQCAVCLSHKTLSDMLGIHQTTVKKAMKVLKDGNWIQVVQIGQNGTVNAYIVNSRVAWADKRDNLKLSRFHAVIVANAEDQTEQTLEGPELKKVPLIYPPDETPLPTGEWPNSETGYLEGIEPTAEGWPEE